MSASGFRGDAYLFAGFLPATRGARRKALGELATPLPIVFYEAPHRVLECVEDLAAVLGGARAIVVARELTKLFEEIHRCPLSEAAAWLAAQPNRQKGEFVLVVDGAPEAQPADQSAELERVLRALLEELPLAQAVKLASAATGAKRNAVYARALELAGRKGET